MSIPRVRKKLVLVGDGECGKTCVLKVYSGNIFPKEYCCSYDDHTTSIEFEGKNIELTSWDTAGQEDYDRLHPLCYPNTHVILMCFSIADPYSLSRITKYWIPEVKRFGSKVPIILVGNKKDLRNEPKTIQRLRANKQETVKYEDGKKVAVSMNAFAYLECSALKNEGIEEVFKVAVQAALKAEMMEKKKKESCVLL